MGPTEESAVRTLRNWAAGKPIAPRSSEVLRRVQSALEVPDDHSPLGTAWRLRAREAMSKRQEDNSVEPLGDDEPDKKQEPDGSEAEKALRPLSHDELIAIARQLDYSRLTLAPIQKHEEEAAGDDGWIETVSEFPATEATKSEGTEQPLLTGSGFLLHPGGPQTNLMIEGAISAIFSLNCHDPHQVTLSVRYTVEQLDEELSIGRIVRAALKSLELYDFVERISSGAEPLSPPVDTPSLPNEQTPEGIAQNETERNADESNQKQETHDSLEDVHKSRTSFGGRWVYADNFRDLDRFIDEIISGKRITKIYVDDGMELEVLDSMIYVQKILDQIRFRFPAIMNATDTFFTQEERRRFPLLPSILELLRWNFTLREHGEAMVFMLDPTQDRPFYWDTDWMLRSTIRYGGLYAQRVYR